MSVSVNNSIEAWKETAFYGFVMFAVQNIILLPFQSTKAIKSYDTTLLDRSLLLQKLLPASLARHTKALKQRTRLTEKLASKANYNLHQSDVRDRNLFESGVDLINEQCGTVAITYIIRPMNGKRLAFIHLFIAGDECSTLTARFKYVRRKALSTAVNFMKM
ncbi:CLUMA_CG013779, isoform A [Clunio marinus]|uniref:CLUMA_CG013779, isoform A n=1 Tax=Clunio marinus TaxID=568069 RepID=A0A1J1IN46_9DIPT|nr:CLUMA_CG013779, isoform A [Clunio marinus]